MNGADGSSPVPASALRGKSAARARRLAACVPGALLVWGASIAVAAVVPGTYRGLTSERIEVKFKVSSDRHHILGFSSYVGYNGKCGSGGGPSFLIKVKSIPLSRAGNFVATTRATGPVASVQPTTVKVSGHVSGRKASGKILDLTISKCVSVHPGAPSYSATFTASAK